MTQTKPSLTHCKVYTLLKIKIKKPLTYWNDILKHKKM